MAQKGEPGNFVLIRLRDLPLTRACPWAAFRQVLAPSPTPTSTLLGMSSPRFLKLPAGSRIEVSPAAFKIARKLGELLHDKESDGARSAGSALIIDYGGGKVYGNSFRVRTQLSTSLYLPTDNLFSLSLGVQEPQDRGRLPPARRV